MSTDGQKLTDTAFLHVTPRFKNGRANGVTINKMTKTKTSSKDLVIKVTIALPPEVFDPLIPEVVIDVPAERVEVVPEVVVTPQTIYTREGEDPLTATFEDDEDA